MTKIMITVVFFLSNLVFAQNTTLTVALSGFDNDKGTVQIGLFNSEGKFLKTIYKGISSKIKLKTATVIFFNIPTGEYAISAYHDKNRNGKLDVNLIGIPKEDFACSNNAKGLIGPPKYKEAKFTISKDLKLEIKFNN